jgi:hypothetical protein
MRTISKATDRDFYDLLFYVFVLLALIFIYGCSTRNNPTLDRGPLMRQRLQFRPGFDGLVNQTCAEFKGEKCLKMDTKVYDLRDEDVRRQLIEVKLMCNVGGHRYRVCRETKGLCRQTEVRSGFLGLHKEIKLVDVKFQERDFQSLLNLNTWCAAQDSTLGQMMFSGDVP